MKAYNFNDKIYITTTNGCLVVEQTNNPEYAGVTSTISKSEFIPPAESEIAVNDVIVLAMLDNVKAFIDVVIQATSV